MEVWGRAAAPALNLAVAAAVSLALLVALTVQARAVAAGVLPRTASRKVGHMGLGSFLLLTWLLYLPDPAARWAAALPPLVLAGAFVALGAGRVPDPRAVAAIAREGERREILQGPLLYVLAFAALTGAFWRVSPVGITALACLVLGDGVAEVAGKGIPSRPLPWNPGKSVAGTAGALAAGWFGSLFFLGVFTAGGHLEAWPLEVAAPALAVAAAGALLESLPWGPWDNLAIALGCAGVGVLVF